MSMSDRRDPHSSESDSLIPADNNPFNDLSFLYSQQTEKSTHTIPQKGMQLAYRYTAAMSTGLFFGAEVMPPAPMPYGVMVGFIAMNMNVLTGDALHALLGKAQPLAYLRRAGNNHLGLGFAKEGGKFVAALIPPTAAGLGIGYAMVTFGEALAQADHPALKVLNFIVTTPMIREPIFGAISFGMHSATKAMIECCVPVPEAGYEPRANLNAIQHVMRFVLRPMGAISLYETMRLALIAAGQEAVLHDPRFPALVVACDQLLQLWAYTAFVPHPMRGLVPSHSGVVVEDLESGMISDDAHTAVTYSKAHALAWYSLRTGFVLGAGAYLLNLGLTHLKEDKEDMVTGYRVGYEAALVLGAQIVEKLVENAPSMVAWTSRKLSTCYAGLFSRQSAPGPVIDDAERLLASPGKI